MYNRSKILVIEETLASIKIIESLFNDEYEVVGIKDIKDALQICGAFRPHLIIQNLVVGNEKNGLSFLQNLKKSEKYRHIPVILASDSSSQETLTEGLKLGASDYIIKPFVQPVLKQKVTNMLLLVANYRDEKMLSKHYGVSIGRKSKNAIMVQLENLVDEILDKEMSSTEIADRLNIAHGTLSRYLKEQFDFTPIQFIQKRKFEKVQTFILSNKEMKLKEVCIKFKLNSVADMKKQYEKFIGDFPRK